MEVERCFGCMQPKHQHPVCEHCGYDERSKNLPHQLQVGSILRGQYLIGKVLGQGGFGITYLGWDLYLDMKVAIKEYYPAHAVTRDCSQSTSVTSYTDSSRDLYEENKGRFMREAKTLAKFAKLRHIVQIYSFFPENNTAYMVMEFLDGMTLQGRLRQKGTMPLKEVVDLLAPVMEDLELVHQAGMVHRDISPDNIILHQEDGAKLLDFGAVREVQNADQNAPLARSTEAILKQGFAPLEQYNSRGSLGPWSDVYALCATICYCLNGKVPTSAPERVLSDTPDGFLDVLPVTGPQREVLRRGMALHPNHRTASVGELLRELRAAVDGGADVPSPGPVIPPEPDPEPVIPLKPEPAPEPVIPLKPEPDPEPVIPLKPEPDPEPVIPLKPEPAPEPVIPVWKQPDVPAKKKSGIWIPIGAAAAAVVLISACVVPFALRSREKNTPTASTAAVQEIEDLSREELLREADLGNVEAMRELGDRCEFEGSYQDAFKWYSRAAEKGDADAQNSLGILYCRGDGVEQDFEQGFYWFSESASQGNPAAQANAGLSYELGNGVERDGNMAVYWYQQAAEQEYAPAMVNLGRYYWNEDNQGFNYEEALRWFQKAVDLGDDQGQYCMAICYRSGYGVEPNMEQALYFYNLAADQGNVNAQRELGDLYDFGEEVEQDQARALDYYRMAAEQNEPWSILSIGYYYMYGYAGLEKDEAKGFRYYHQAAELGESLAQMWLGDCYKNGIGTEVNLPQAAAWYRLAAANGMEEAAESLQTLGEQPTEEPS